MKALFLSMLILLCVSFGDEYVVISNQNMKELSTNQIKAIFLKKALLIDDVQAVPINLEAMDSIRLKFEQDILNMNFSRLKSYWTTQHYLGHRPPLTMKSQESVKSFVKKVDGAIGYINAQNIDESVKVIYRWRD